MARTIGRHWPDNAPRGDTQVMCDLCGVHWRRSQLSRMRDGKLWCPDELPGRDEVTLSELNARNVRRPVPHVNDGGNYDDDSNPPTTYITSGEDIEIS